NGRGVGVRADGGKAIMPGRFYLGVGGGEALNAHITGQRWPETEVRQAMLGEATAVMRLLWHGGNQRHLSGAAARGVD
ncbi:MAG: hypothetical protein ACRDJC_21365, partial [Thermomicrobiales bacterium]